MEEFKNISIRGRMAYLLSSFESLLLHYNYDKEAWSGVLEKLWTFTEVQYIDDWMYEIAEYMPNSILNDTMEDAEYITEKEFVHLYKLYSNSNQDVILFLKIIYECGTCEIYSKLCDYSPNTLKKIEQAIGIMKKNNVAIVSIEEFKRYSFSECGGWGENFENKKLSKFI